MNLNPENPIEVEILQEMAASYFAACRKMVDSLDALKAFDRRFVAMAMTKGETARRSELLANAAERVYWVIIQREAMRLSCYDTFFDHYEIPIEVRARLGPMAKK